MRLPLSAAFAMAAMSVLRGLALVPRLPSVPLDDTKMPHPSATRPEALLGTHSVGVLPPVPPVPMKPPLRLLPRSAVSLAAARSLLQLSEGPAPLGGRVGRRFSRV